MSKSKYETHVEPNLDRIAAWARKGADLKEICKKLKIGETAFRGYLSRAKNGDSRYKGLLDAWEQGKEEPDNNVEAALYKSATGYNAEVIKHYKIRTVEYDETTGKRIRETEELVEATETVHVPANTPAQIFWLTNRRPESWKRSPEQKEKTDENYTGVVLLAPIGEEVTEDGK